MIKPPFLALVGIPGGVGRLGIDAALLICGRRRLIGSFSGAGLGRAVDRAHDVRPPESGQQGVGDLGLGFFVLDGGHHRAHGPDDGQSRVLGLGGGTDVRRLSGGDDIRVLAFALLLFAGELLFQVAQGVAGVLFLILFQGTDHLNQLVQLAAQAVSFGGVLHRLVGGGRGLLVCGGRGLRVQHRSRGGSQRVDLLLAPSFLDRHAKGGQDSLREFAHVLPAFLRLLGGVFY